jgi:hypothetical protein
LFFQIIQIIFDIEENTTIRLFLTNFFAEPTVLLVPITSRVDEAGEVVCRNKEIN